MAINVFETYEVASFAITVLGMPSYMNQQSFVVATQQQDYLYPENSGAYCGMIHRGETEIMQGKLKAMYSFLPCSVKLRG